MNRPFYSKDKGDEASESGGGNYKGEAEEEEYEDKEENEEEEGEELE